MFKGVVCDGCAEKRRSTSLCVYGLSPDATSASGFLFCQDCMLDTSKRSQAVCGSKDNDGGSNTDGAGRGANNGKKKNSRQARGPRFTAPATWLQLTEAERRSDTAAQAALHERRHAGGSPPTLGFLALRTMALGVVHRVPSLSAARLSGRLSAPSRSALVDLLLELCNCRSDNFAAQIKTLAWRTPPAAEAEAGTEAGAEAGAELLEAGTLSLRKCAVTAQELELVEYFCETQPVDLLDVSWNRMQPAEGAALARVLAHDRCAALDASWNALGPEGARLLSLAVAPATRLRRLVLTSNALGPRGAAHVATALAANRSLEEVNLGFNGILAAGARKLAAALKRNDVVRELNLRSNGIGPDGAFALADLLRCNRTLARVIVVDNNIGPEGAEAIAGFFSGTIPDLIHSIRGASGPTTALSQA